MSQKGKRRTFLVECYTPGVARPEVEAAALRVEQASAELRDEGCTVEYVGSIFVPTDEAVYHLLAAGCPGAAREVSARAALAFERVVESLSVGPLEAAGRKNGAARPHTSVKGES